MEEEAAELFTHFEFEESDDDEEEDTLENENGRREICENGCSRPAKVCLCNELPSKPLLTSTKIVILHHPHEVRHKLATVPILAKCLQNCETLIGRRLHLGSSPLLDSLYETSIDDPLRPHRAIYLFPGTDSSPAIELNDWVSSATSSSYSTSSNETEIRVLIVFDGTWKHAKEMVSASLPFLSKFATRVCLKYDVRVDGESIFDSELVLRKEPFSGCMSTIEAVARSLRVLETTNNGVEIEERLISVLRAMVKFQASYLIKKPVKPRPRLLKKKKVEKNGDIVT
ncbi:DTW [Macleaya cordata]|uniref:tRNA-uridine aminocarboxypropyltransferase n=1 Tax=Macleaya cordata TaxID=56857 RepID=A0A200R703_MACCD|nr:DTW [Macleaya cordata]